MPDASSRSRAAAFAFLALVSAGCAHVRGGPGSLAGVDVRAADGALATLAPLQGRIVVLDICTSWAEACHINARAMSQARRMLPDEDVALVTVLLDELPAGALKSYVDVVEAAHRVVLAGPRVRDGKSVLGEVGGVPRLVVLDRQGRVIFDESGGVLSAEGLVRRVRALL